MRSGNPGRRQVNSGPAGLAGKPRCPAIVRDDKVAMEAWRRVCRDLDEMGLLSRSDVSVIARYCLSWSRYVGVAEKLAQLGGQIVLVSKRTKQPYITAFAGAEQMLSTRLDKLEAELGLTPGARARLGLTLPFDEGATTGRFRIAG